MESYQPNIDGPEPPFHDPYLHQLVLRVRDVLPRWEAHFFDLIDTLRDFDEWRPHAPEDLGVPSSRLEQAISEHLEGAANALHNLWCLHAWASMDIEEGPSVAGLRLALVRHLRERCARTLSHGNLVFLPEAPPGLGQPEQWASRLRSCEHGASMSMHEWVESPVLDHDEGVRGCPAPELPRRTKDPRLKAYELALQAASERLAFFSTAAKIAEGSPLVGFILVSSQVGAALDACRDNDAGFMLDRDAASIEGEREQSVPQASPASGTFNGGGA